MKAFFHIVGRSAAIRAIFILHAEELAQDSFTEHGRHADDGCNPHPENSPRTAGGQAVATPTRLPATTSLPTAAQSAPKPDTPPSDEFALFKFDNNFVK